VVDVGYERRKTKGEMRNGDIYINEDQYENQSIGNKKKKKKKERKRERKKLKMKNVFCE
jgi:hypothetical protein